MQLAKELSVSFSTVNRWEKGCYKAIILVKRRFENLCKEHGITFDETKAGE